MAYAIALVLIPTLLWTLITMWIRPKELSLGWLVAGFASGIMLGAPVWLLETAVEAITVAGDRYWEDFAEQVLGAACSEESLKFVAIGGLIWLASREASLTARSVVAISVAVGVGFMTLENGVAVLASDTPEAIAFDRQLTVLSGHGSYQAIMGCFLAVFLQRRRSAWIAAALFVPLFLHAWGNLSDQLFRDEPDPDSFEDALLFNTWIGSIITTALTAFSLLWWTRTQEPDSNRMSNPETD